MYGTNPAAVQRARSGYLPIRYLYMRHEPCWFSASLENAGGMNEA